MNSVPGIAFQILQSVFVVLAAPLLTGWVNQCRAWLQNRSAPSILLPYFTLAKLFHKDAVFAHDASSIFRWTPYILFGCMWLAAGIVPVLATGLPFAPAADIIALVGVFALARMFSALAAMDIGTSFGGLGARREMLIGFLAEPAMLMTLFTAAFISGSTQLTTIVDTLAHREFALYPSLAFAAVAFLMVLLAENARIPIDNPTTHLELTMVHEALILEYSARHLALIEWAVAIKLFAYMTIGIALFAPWGIADAGDWSALPYAGAALATSTVIVAWSTGQDHLYVSAVLTVLFKVILIPWLLHWLIDRLFVRWDIETLINIPTTMLIGIGLVIFAFALATPISQMATTLTRSTLGIALASVLLSFLMMIVRQKAVPQVIGFLAMENGLFFAATSATYGMPLVVELGVALDVLVGTFIFGIFFFHIRERFDSLDIRHMEKLKED